MNRKQAMEILSETYTKETADYLTSVLDLKDPETAWHNLRSLAGKGDLPELLEDLLPALENFLKDCPDSDGAITNWERIVIVLADPSEHYRYCHNRPDLFRNLLVLISASEFFTRILIDNPPFLTAYFQSTAQNGIPEEKQLLNRFLLLNRVFPVSPDWRGSLRTKMEQEILQIGLQERIGNLTAEGTCRKLAEVYSVCLLTLLDKGLQEAGINDKNAVQLILTGQTAEKTMGYSGEVSFMAFFSNDLPFTVRKACKGVILQISKEAERIFSRDRMLRFRLANPQDSGGEDFLYTIEEAVNYAEKAASLDELREWMMSRPISGELEQQQRWKTIIRKRLNEPLSPVRIAMSLDKFRREYLQNTEEKPGVTRNGSLLEALGMLKALLWIHTPAEIENMTPDNILSVLQNHGIMTQEITDKITDCIQFMFSLEHVMEIADDFPMKKTPAGIREQAAIARALGFSKLKSDTETAEELQELLRTQNGFISEMYGSFIKEPDKPVIAGSE